MNTTPIPEIWKALHDSLILTAEDAQKLRTKRGFSPSTIEALGFKSSVAGNRAIIHRLSEIYGVQTLAQMGVMSRSARGDFYPNSQLCGFGMTGDKDDKGEAIWLDGVNPILIPYFDASGEITGLRPHKGNIKKPEGIDEFNEEYSGIHVYCPHLLRTVATLPINQGTDPGLCVITEGEFKAAALWQCGIPALAMPGIQSLKNRKFKDELVKVLNQFSIREAVVVFDNEIKDNPEFSNYKPDPWDRYDTLVYARYTSRTLFSEGVSSTKIAQLPDDWRINGKADWDGALASFTAKHGLDAGTETARREFLKVINRAGRDKEILELFPTEATRIVEAKLSRIYHTSKCLIGGDDEARLASRLRKVDSTVSLSHAFRTVIGCYYTRKAMKEGKKREEIELTLSRLTAKDVKESADWLNIRALRELLNGYPEAISNFTLTCDFKLIAANGKTEYLARVRNIHNEKTERHVRIGGQTLAKLTEFRAWCLDNVAATWGGGEKDLQNLTADMQAASAFREIHEIDTYGYSDQCNLWKFGNRAFTPDGKIILPDKNMVFWHEGVGYQTDFNPKELGSGFLQGAPVFDDLDNEKAVNAFLLLQEHLHDAIGDYDGWLALGQMLSYAAHPEILRAYMGAPGLWFTGRKGGGKSTIASWLMQIWGFKADKPFVLTGDTTNNSVARELSKYGCIPCWLDEFRADRTRVEVQDILKNAFNRSAGAKATFDSSKRTRAVRPETTPFVTGESSTIDAATRSRYTNITILDERAKGNAQERLKIMNEAAPTFHHLGHFVMKNRPRFVELTMKNLDEWVNNEGVAKIIPKARERFVAGTPYAAFCAVAEMLETVATPDQKAGMFDVFERKGNFMALAMEHGGETQQETMETGFVNQFWRDLMTMVSSGTLPKRFMVLKYAKVESDRTVKDLMDYTGSKVLGHTPILFLAYKEAFMEYEKQVRMAGRTARLSLDDTYRELRREKYWVRPRERQSYRIGTGADRLTCWAFNLVDHPYGEEFMDLLSPETKEQPLSFDSRPTL